MTTLSFQSFTQSKAPTKEIVALFTQTFSDSESEESGKVIATLVEDLLSTTPEDELKIFAAFMDEKLAGCILFTPLRFESETAYLLSPVATLTAYQGKGVAQGLINYGLQALKALNINLAFTYGDPNFYSKVGFLPVSNSDFEAPHPLSQPHGWLAQSLTEEKLVALSGKSVCAKGLNNPEYW